MSSRHPVQDTAKSFTSFVFGNSALHFLELSRTCNFVSVADLNIGGILLLSFLISSLCSLLFPFYIQCSLPWSDHFWLTRLHLSATLYILEFVFLLLIALSGSYSSICSFYSPTVIEPANTLLLLAIHDFLKQPTVDNFVLLFSSLLYLPVGCVSCPGDGGCLCWQMFSSSCLCSSLFLVSVAVAVPHTYSLWV